MYLISSPCFYATASWKKLPGMVAKDHQYYYILESIYRMQVLLSTPGLNIEYLYRCIEENWRLLLSRAKTNQNKTNPEKITNKTS